MAVLRFARRWCRKIGRTWRWWLPRVLLVWVGLSLIAGLAPALRELRVGLTAAPRDPLLQCLGRALQEAVAAALRRSPENLIVYATTTVLIWGTLLRAHRKRRRSRVPECARCGYDLTGNISGRCPECGTPVSAMWRRKLGTMNADAVQPHHESEPPP